jgi:membrane associated rhomboid family serine protease
MNAGYGQPSFDLRSFFRERSVLNYLIILNISVWVVIQVLRVLLYLYSRETAGQDLHRVIDLLAVPAYLPTLLHQPWSLFTYMVLHENIWHILFNMLWLYWFGKIFLQYLSQRQLLMTYLLGGATGGLVYIFAYNVFPVFGPVLADSYALGASASVMAIVTAISFHVPNYSLYLLLIGRVRIVYLAIALFVFDFFMIPSGNAGGHIAHIGGALFGFTWVRLIYPAFTKKLRGRRFTAGNPFRDLFRKWKKSSKNESFSGRPMTDDEYNRKRAENQHRIDEILEKISRGGYESLTREEKELLFRSSRKS